MQITFFQPPAAQSIGGLDAALKSLRAALTARGLQITETLPEGGEDQVVHFHGLWQPSDARLTRECIARGLPYVISPHGMLEPWAWRHKLWKKWPYFHLIEKRRLAAASALLATGTLEAGRLRRFAPRQRIESIPLGLTGEARPNYQAARRQLGWAPDEIVVLFLSRLHVKKGPGLLLKAFANLPVPAVTRLVIVGDGEPGFVESLKAFASGHAHSLPRIDWAGAIWGDKRWAYFQGADLFCLPTHSENFGLAVLEACQVGTPVLTTVDTPWAGELPGAHGIIAEPTVASLTEALRRFFAQPRATVLDRQILSQWAWERFAWPGLAERYEALYRSCLTGRT